MTKNLKTARAKTTWLAATVGPTNKTVQENTDKQTQYKSEKVNNLKYSKTKLPWFSCLLQHSARKWGALILQCPRAHTGPSCRGTARPNYVGDHAATSSCFVQKNRATQRHGEGPCDATLCREKAWHHLVQIDQATPCRAEVLFGDRWCRGTARCYVDRSTCRSFGLTSGGGAEMPRSLWRCAPALANRLRIRRVYAEHIVIQITAFCDCNCSVLRNCLWMGHGQYKTAWPRRWWRGYVWACDYYWQTATEQVCVRYLLWVQYIS